MADLILHEPSGLFFPWTEPRAQKMYDGLLKYINDSDFLLSLLQKSAKNRVCIQAGGHIGMWPIRLAPYFREVITFEPDPPVFQALKRNVEGKNIRAVEGALGETSSYALLSWYTGRTGTSTIASVKAEGDRSTTVPVYTIDELDEDVAAIVLDVEEYEPYVLRGARETIARCRPLIMCEMLQRSRQAIIDTLAEMGYQKIDNVRKPKCRDTVFGYRGKA